MAQTGGILTGGLIGTSNYTLQTNVRVKGDAQPVFTSPDTHSIRQWGAVQTFDLQVGSIGAAQAITTFIGAGYLVCPFRYAYLYDIFFYCSAHEANPATCTIDVFDTVAAGTAAANSYLSAPFSIASTLASAARSASARDTPTTPNFYGPFDPTLYPGNDTMGLVNWRGSAYTAGTRNIPLLLQQGQIFSVRASTTAGTGAITNLGVMISIVPSDLPGIINRG